MHNAADRTIIDARLAASVIRQMRHKPRELTIVEPEMISIIEVPPSGTLNQKMRCLGIRFMGPNPNTECGLYLAEREEKSSKTTKPSWLPPLAANIASPMRFHSSQLCRFGIAATISSSRSSVFVYSRRGFRSGGRSSSASRPIQWKERIGSAPIVYPAGRDWAGAQHKGLSDAS